jgi:U3 small nucleolar RNA-associated protein MPP10
MTEELDTKTALNKLIECLDNPETHIIPLLYNGSKSQSISRDDLIQVIQHLFLQNERLAKKYKKLVSKDDEESSGLSGLPELYYSPGIVDAETIWGQIDLQNMSLNKLVKKSTKRLGKAPEKVCVLNMNEVLSDQDNETSSSIDNDDDSNKSASDDEEKGENDSVDTTTRRMRERMEKALEDMDSDKEDEAIQANEQSNKNASSDEESLEDPVAEELKDGFFDLNEMEEFADEEEAYLPEEAFGQPKPEKKNKNKKSFHQKQRDGDFDNSDDDDDDFEEMYEDVEPVQRKKYRDEKEIDALYTLYQPAKVDDNDDYSDDGEEVENDPADMTAADFFGKPKMNYYERYYKGKGGKKKAEKVQKDDDDDSWGDYDFDEEDEKGWRDETVEASANADDFVMDEDKEEEEVNEKEDENEGKKADNSRHSKQTEKLRKQTEQLEKEMLAEKPWQMTGETTSTKRPVNSLLEGTPEFEMASKQAPTITVEQTANLEEIIKKRILAEDWDDVIPRELPDVGWHKKRGELPEVSQEKSKLGLGELYEREYLKKATGYDVDAVEKQTEEDKAKDEMKRLFANLCSKLDALSNYHFAPRPVSDEAEVRTVTAPAIAMEEVLPLHVSDARGIAPEEVFATKRGRKGVLRGESEMEQTDRKRLRSSKKAARRKSRKEKLADEKLISRLTPGLGLNNPYEKRKMREELAMARSRGKVTTGEQDVDTKFGSSGTFFKRLQSEAQQSIQSGKSSSQDDSSKNTRKTKSSVYKL